MESRTPDQTRRPERGNRKSVFVAGFVESQWENQSLSGIVQSLLPYYYVSQNPTSTQSWTRSLCREMVGSADAVIFFIHEASLEDKRCLLVLQTAWELMVPIIMLRHPRMKLLITGGKQQRNPSFIANRLNNHQEPDLDLLRDILFEGYKNSVSYDRFQHNAGIRHLKHRLSSLLEPDLNRSFRFTLTPNPTQENLLLKLPPIGRPPPPPKNIRSALRSAPIYGRSRSVSSVSDESFGEPRKKPKRKRKEEKDAKTRSDLNSLSSITSLDDEALYHETTYMVFPVRDKSVQPRLIHFPADLIKKGEELKLESIWGSETSLEEEFERAEVLRGDLDVTSPSPTLAPFNDPI